MSENDDSNDLLEALRDCEYSSDAILILRSALLAAEERGRVAERGKRAPVQGFSAGIPWAMHLRAYDVYCNRYGRQEAMIDLEGRNCRGGVGVSELDMFIPGWRDEISVYTELEALKAERLPTLMSAFRTSESCGPDKLYRMIFKFGSLADLQKAEDEFLAFAAIRASTTKELEKCSDQ